MRYPDGSLVGDFNDGFDAQSSSSLTETAVSTLNENETTYDLLPIVVNRPPILTVPIVNGSSPSIKQISLSDGSGNHLYVNQDGVVRVCINSTLTLSMTAIQPNVYNVENGVPLIKSSSVDLVYQWKVNENVVAPFVISSLRSEVTIDANKITIRNIQPQHNGTYTCEVSNDIGTLVSEPVTIEVYNPEADPLLFTNLIQNGFAEEGVDGWSANSPNDFVSKEMSLLSAEQLKTVNAINVFGYTSDMMHPRPYQIEAGTLKQADYSSKLTEGGNYFTRTNYQLVSMGGVNFVKAYQDVDLSDLRDVISGGVYGISGLRAIFGCYIGQAVSNYRPTVELTPLNSRTKRREYFFGAPRLSAENWLSAGFPEIIDRVYVTLEEFENETRLPSTIRLSTGTEVVSNPITLVDPYTIKTWNDAPYYSGSQRFPTDVFELGISTPAETRFRDQIFYRADELMPDYKDRFTFGQYVEFNRVVLERINPKTTKIRISIVFECDNHRVLEPSLYARDLGGEVKDFVGWDVPAEKNTFGETDISGSIFKILNPPGLENVPSEEKFLTQPEPRPMVTGLSLGLVPILTGSAELTEYYTNTTLAQNNLPSSSVPSTLLNIPFDPFGKRNRDLEVTFFNEASFSSESRDLTAIQLKVIPKTGNSWFLVPSQSLFPFSEELPVDIHINNTLSDTEELKTWRVLSSRRGATTDDSPQFGSVPTSSLPQNLAGNRFVSRQIVANAAQKLGTDYYSKAIAERGELAFDQNGSLSLPKVWNNKSRFLLHYTTRKRVEPSSIVEYATDNKVLQDNFNVYQQSQNNAFTNKLNELNSSLKYNSYVLEIQHPTISNLDVTGSQVTLSRPLDLVGKGSLPALQLEHGVTDNKLFFKLPEKLLMSSLEEGGFGMGYDATLVAKDVTVPRANGFPIDFMLLNAREWWRLGQLYGDTARRQTIASVFPSEEENVEAIAANLVSGVIPETTPFVNEYPNSWAIAANRPRLPFLGVGQSGSLSINQQGFIVYPALSDGNLKISLNGSLRLSKLINQQNSAAYRSPTKLVVRVRTIDPFTNAFQQEPVVATKTIDLQQLFSQTDTSFDQLISETFEIAVASTSFQQLFAITVDYDVNGPIQPSSITNNSGDVVNRVQAVEGFSITAVQIKTPIVRADVQSEQRIAAADTARQRLYTLLSSSAAVVVDQSTNPQQFLSSVFATQGLASLYTQTKRDYENLWGANGQTVVIKSMSSTSHSIETTNTVDPNLQDFETYQFGIVSGSTLFGYTARSAEAFYTFVSTQSGSLSLVLNPVSSSICSLCFLNDANLVNFPDLNVDIGQPTPILTGSRNYDYAASLYAVQALDYGSEPSSNPIIFGGTPVFGYDQERNSYNVVIKPIVDTIIRDTPPIPSPLI